MKIMERLCAVNWTDQEEREAYILGTIGLAKGIHEVFVVPFFKEEVLPKITPERVAFAGGLLLGSVLADHVISAHDS